MRASRQADTETSLGELAQDKKFMSDVWSEEVGVLEKKVPEVRGLG